MVSTTAAPAVGVVSVTDEVGVAGVVDEEEEVVGAAEAPPVDRSCSRKSSSTKVGCPSVTTEFCAVMAELNR